MKWRENYALYVGILVPVLMVLFVAGSIYFPSLFSKEQPQYDFLYTLGPTYSVASGTRYDYVVKDGKLIREEYDISGNGYSGRFAPQRSDLAEEPRFYRYDVVSGKTEEVSLSDAEKLTLRTQADSPDGFRVVRTGSGGLFFFGVSDNQSRVLVGKHYRQKLHINYDAQTGYYGFHFLGWVVDSER